jgi:DNA-binding IscR family transcriptional regulator
VEGLENYNRCILGFEECSDDNPCPLHDYWLPIRDQINHLLYHVSLANLVEKVQHKI